MAGSRELDGLSTIGAKVGAGLVELGYYFVFSLTPEVPRDVWTHFSWRRRRIPALITFLSTLLFTFGLTAFFALLDRRLMPDPLRDRFNFLEDYANLFLYGFICPVYVTLCVMLTGAASSYWAKRRNSRREQRRIVGVRPIRTALALIGIIVASSLFITQYQFDLLNSPSMPVEYWFLTETNGVRVPNRAGFYYLILNFGLLFVTLLGAMSYLSIAFEAIREARRLDPEAVCRNPNITKIADAFKPFYTAAMLCKLLILCYIINTIVWRYSPLGQSTGDNIAVSVALLLLLGFGGTWLPTRIVEKRLSELRIACWQNGLPADALNLIPNFQRWVRFVADALALFVSWSFVFVVYPKWDPLDQLPPLLEWLLQVR